MKNPSDKGFFVRRRETPVPGGALQRPAPEGRLSFEKGEVSHDVTSRDGEVHGVREPIKERNASTETDAIQLHPLKEKRERGTAANRSQLQELSQMRENVQRAVNSLELCRRCHRIAECQLWIFNTFEYAWYCSNCVTPGSIGRKDKQPFGTFR
jgi:hypothetical protein